MSSRAPKRHADSDGRVIQQLAAQPADGRSKAMLETNLKANESHAATTIVERIANVRRGYLVWLAEQTRFLTGKEPAIDSDADASWRAR